VTFAKEAADVLLVSDSDPIADIVEGRQPQTHRQDETVVAASVLFHWAKKMSVEPKFREIPGGVVLARGDGRDVTLRYRRDADLALAFEFDAAGGEARGACEAALAGAAEAYREFHKPNGFLASAVADTAARVAESQMKLDAFVEEHGDPDVEIAEIAKKMAVKQQELEAAKAGIKNDIAGEIEKLKDRAMELSIKSVDLDRLRRQAKNDRELANLTNRRMEEHQRRRREGLRPIHQCIEAVCPL
jgi:hypothetical protein